MSVILFWVVAHHLRNGAMIDPSRIKPMPWAEPAPLSGSPKPAGVR
jgi:hypothetical protein